VRILFLSPVLPHAKVVSGSIIIYNRIKLLAERGYEVGLACFRSPGEDTRISDLQPLLREFESVPSPAARHPVSAQIPLFFCHPPYPFCTVRSRAMHRLVGAMVDRSRYDAVIAEFSVMGQFLYQNPYLSATRRIISCHSCLTTSYLKAIDVRRWALHSLRNRLWLKRLEKYEFAMYRSADLVLALTAQERMDLLRYGPNLRVSVVPYGVDIEHFHPRSERDTEDIVAFTGFYTDDANRDAVMWFAHAVWPLLKARHPALKFYVIGRNPAPDIRDLARKDPQIVVTGEVPDVAPYLARARIYVCPMRMGTGFRGKILQAMASGVPVVATTSAAEGIMAQTGDSIMLADTPHVMAEAINLLLSDAELRKSIARSAREMVVKRYAWTRCVDLLENVLRDVVE
jgi:glycosyltransferase involved in cell wall biosynthesis